MFLWLPVFISIAALCLSGISLWQSTWRRGKLCMTKPSLLFIGREGPRNEPKIFMRALLFSTAQRGWVIEQLYLRATNQGGSYLFDFWGYGETEKLSPGSGLFIGQQGAVYNHHFLTRPGNAEDFIFYDGEYQIEVFAKVFDREKPIQLSTFSLLLGGNHAAQLIQIMDMAVYFEWDIDSGKYKSRTERRPRNN